MKKKDATIYRIFLLVALLSVLVGGACYCYRVQQAKKEPKGGTLVKNQYEKWRAMDGESDDDELA